MELDEEHTKCSICVTELSSDRDDKDPEIRKHLPVLSSSQRCDHWFCHGCILREQLRVAEENNGRIPKWLKCMHCREKTSFNPAEPKYHRLLIDLLARAENSPKDSSSETDFMHLTEVLNNAIPRRRGTEVIEDIYNRRQGNIHLPKEKVRSKWADQVARYTKGEAARSLQIYLTGVPKTFPFRGESYEQIRAGKSDTTDLTELNLFVLGRVIQTYCMKKHGGSSDDTIDDMVRDFLDKSVYNFSGDWKCNKINNIGSDANKGVAAGVFVQAMYVVGNVFKVQEEVVTLFDSLGRGHLSQQQHWNGLSK
eukprot:scaffold18977_cov76-Skeletonema_dohrnii-CCMP3373.AAC.3